ncbi:unnamed protein product [Pleuronectes platessa]|uniref:Uncharacterized protein n=1 Tax=Pleuronectes platessa TaxID=8262 RepID=A0A9N7ULJ7_PLEPL|nr:unnamed protein product [Pleuronectes platessa]
MRAGAPRTGKQRGGETKGKEKGEEEEVKKGGDFGKKCYPADLVSVRGKAEAEGARKGGTMTPSLSGA